MTHSFPTRRSSVLRGEKAEILIYNTDDRTGGFVNESYPITVEIGGSSYDFPVPSEQLAAVIIAEAYLCEGNRRVKVANEGYTFGIEAFARARQFRSEEQTAELQSIMSISSAVLGLKKQHIQN